MTEQTPRYEVAKVEAADGRTWAIFDTTGDADVPAGIVDRRIFLHTAEREAAALEALWIGIQESWPACEYDGCNEPSAAGSEFCTEHQAEHEANMRADAAPAPSEIERRMALATAAIASVDGKIIDEPTPTCDCGRGPMLQGNGAPDICQECLDEGRGIYPEGENAASRAEAAGDNAECDYYQGIDTALVICLERIGQEASCALEIDRSDEDAIERLSACLDGIERLATAARRHLKEIAELS